MDISHAAAPLSPPTYVAPLSLLPSLTFDLTGGGENLYVDYSSGSPMPSGGLSLAATGTGDGLTVVGSGLSQSVTLGSSQVSLAGGGAAVTWTGLSSLSLQDCTATFSGTISPPALSVNAGAAFSGSGTLIAAVTLVGGALSGPMTIQGNLTSTGGSISPAAGAGAPGTLTVVGNVTLDAATTLNFQLAAPYVVGGGSSDLLAITGNLSLNGTLAISADSAFATGGYTLITYTGTLSGAA